MEKLQSWVAAGLVFLGAVGVSLGGTVPHSGSGIPCLTACDQLPGGLAFVCGVPALSV